MNNPGAPSERQFLAWQDIPKLLRERGTNVVLFCETSACREQGQRAGDGWLRLIEAGTELLGGDGAEAGNPLGAS